MIKLEYNLFRVTFIKPRQKALFNEKITTEELFISSLKQKPSNELRKNQHWHIGNLNFITNNSGAFAIGKTTLTSVEKFDSMKGDFIESLQEESPYTNCIFDANLGIVGILKKTSLGRTTRNIAQKLGKLLSCSDAVIENNITVEVRTIPDPAGFIQSLSNAHRILKFSATFKGPNPFDADTFFQKPLSVYLSAANGERGSASIIGENLNKETIIAVTRSTAATGNEAKAKIQKNKGESTVFIDLKGDKPISISYKHELISLDQVISDLREKYEEVRHDSRN